jgi:hypothetical protein|tara:strand:+ start:1591 stop:2364 length:774 start_codon:yes stop_codon:yes gene_type:complete
MAWKYPPNPIAAEYVVDNIAVNENYLSVVDEANGYLNEHNFSARDGFIVERPSLAPGYALRLYYSFKDVNSGTNTVELGASLPTNWVRIRATPSYQTFSADGLTLTFTSRGGPTWLCASFTLHNHPVGADRDSPPFPAGGILDHYRDRKGFGFNLALQLDGSVLSESLVGSGDPTNDFYNDESNVSDTTAAGIKIYPKGGGGVQGAVNAIVLDTVVDLEPGQHTVNVAVQNILSSNGIGKNVAAISSRELFALELTR